MKILLISYEFTFSPFSGNGILARSLVQSILDLDKSLQITVWCCKPSNDEGESESNSDHHIDSNNDRLTVIPYSLTKHDGWKRLDKECAWAKFVYCSPTCNQDINELSPQPPVPLDHDIVCAIDWHGVHAWRSLPPRNNDCPLVYLNFRVYSSGTNDDDHWYDSMERRAVHDATRVLCLSETDAISLRRYNPTNLDILLPPLRSDMAKLVDVDLSEHLPISLPRSLTHESSRRQRCLVTCVVRLSPEKTVRRFLTFVKASKSLLAEMGLVPLLAGAASDATYAQSIKDELLDLVPDAVIVDTFLSPVALAALFQRTLINFHPCAYDAYGMTIIEAAAMGAISVVSRHHVGATAICGAGASIQVSMPRHDERSLEGIGEIGDILQNEIHMKALAAEAKERALAWDDTAYGRALLGILNETLHPRL